MTETIATDEWEALDWFEIEHEVFRIQKRIFNASRKGDRNKMFELQKLLLRSRNARLLAVRKAAQDGRGKNTPGIDGQKSLTRRQKMILADRLTLDWKTLPVSRAHIPKPGSHETRPLGIPTIADRAHQHLIHLALEPQSEARYSSHQYGFRRGRSAHDAISSCRKWILRTPQWALRLDIEKFFDRLDHEAILKKLETYPAMERAIRRILKSGACEGSVLTTQEAGTPQGGPLSPLLANTALSDLETAIHDAFPPSRQILGAKVGKRPRIVIYADDATVMHPDPIILEAVRDFIADWLRPLGLSLNPSKTTMSHTLVKHAGTAGFDFLGFHLQQFRTGRHQMRSYEFFRGVYTQIGPSKDSMKRLRQKCRTIIKSSIPHKRHKAARVHQEAKGKATPQEILIHRLNPLLRGWANYHRHQNAKGAFSRIDHDLFQMLWKWAKRAYPGTSRIALAKTLFNKVNQSAPWHFRSTRTDRPSDLVKVAKIPIQRFNPVQAERSFYDGDAIYWAKRSGKYPCLPHSVAIRIKRQGGKCAICTQSFTTHTNVVLQQFDLPDTENRVSKAVHHSCSTNPSDRDQVQHTC